VLKNISRFNIVSFPHALEVLTLYFALPVSVLGTSQRLCWCFKPVGLSSICLCGLFPPQFKKAGSITQVRELLQANFWLFSSLYTWEMYYNKNVQNGNSINYQYVVV